MSIKMRRGLKINLDKTKLVPGEFAFQLDTHNVTACFGDGITRDMATVEQFSEIIINADSATKNASKAAKDAETAIVSANEATKIANEAATDTKDAIRNANMATQESELATSKLNSALDKIDTVTSKANTAAIEANKATDNANSIVGDAEKAKNEANTAAERANTAAETCEEIIIGSGFIPISEKGTPSGIATLDDSGKVPVIQLPEIQPSTKDTLGGVLSGGDVAVSSTGAVTVLNMVRQSAIANDLTTTDTFKVLSASMGKQLNSVLTSHTADTVKHFNGGAMPADADFNDYMINGVYGFGVTSSMVNAPSFNYGSLIVFRNVHNYIVQMAYCVSKVELLFRTRDSANWSNWNRVSLIPGPWTTPPLLNGWTAYDSLRTLRYRLQGKQVYLNGLVKGGTVGSAIATLPSGFRPARPLSIATTSNNKFASIFISVDGQINSAVADSEWVSFDGISFFID